MKTKTAAKKLQSMGTGDDTILAHINPEEAAVLKAGGGSGKRNPRTGLLSFGGYEGEGTNFEGNGFQGGDWGDAGIAAGNMAAAMQNAAPAVVAPAAPVVPPSIMDNILSMMGKLPGTIGLAGKIGNYLNNEYKGRGTGVSGGGGNDAYGINWGGGNFGAQRDGNGFSGPPDYLSNTPPGLLNPVAPVAGLPAATPSPFTPSPFTPKFGKPRGLLSTNMRGFLGG